MKNALRKKPFRAENAKPKFLPAPTKGWYVGANLADAPEGTAYNLVNVFPQLDYIRARRGSASWATGLPASAVNSLLVWTGAGGSKMFAATGTAIYDVSIGGAVGAAAVTGLGSSSWESVQMSATGATTRLLIANGVDPVQNYDGTTWATAPTITGLTNPVSHLWIFKSRVYLVESGTLNAWYLPLAAIGGAAVKFELGGIFRLGGALLCGATWAIESNFGVFESCIFITTEGEVAMYDGPYPGDPTWVLKGIYKISRPLGVRCLMKAGGDLAIMTEDGIVPMSKVQTLDQVALQNQAVTAPIAPAWRQAVLNRAGLSGWQIVLWPLESMGIINLPKINSADKTQFIVNARTGAWSQYTGWDANCFAVYKNSLYFGGSSGTVFQAETGGSDNGAAYTITIFPSFNSLNEGGNRKQTRMVRPFIQSNYTITPAITINADFDTTMPNGAGVAIQTGSSLWDVALWDVALWGSPLVSQTNWYGAGNYGVVIAAIMQVTFNGSVSPDMRLTATEIIYESGNEFG